MEDALAQPDPPKPKGRRRWQFGLRTALIAMLVIGAGLGVLIRQERRTNRLFLIAKYEEELVEVLKFESPFIDRKGQRFNVLVFSDYLPTTRSGGSSIIVIANEQFEELTRAEVLGISKTQPSGPKDLFGAPMLTFEAVSHGCRITSRYSLADGIELIDRIKNYH